MKKFFFKFIFLSIDMFQLPDEIWNYIKDFIFDWKRSHKYKMNSILPDLIKNSYEEIYHRWTHFPPWSNTNDIITAEYLQRLDWAPPPNLPLTSITWNINANKNGGWWCGYGWAKKNKYK